MPICTDCSASPVDAPAHAQGLPGLHAGLRPGAWESPLPYYSHPLDVPALISAAARAAEHGGSFFAYSLQGGFALDDHVLRFRSPYRSPYRENNTAMAFWRPAPDPCRRAVIVIPHWGAAPQAYAGLCRVLNWAGISCLEMVTPYHGPRSPEGCTGASFALSADLFRTVAAARQATLEIRCCADWLESRGYRSLGLVGTSLGSSYVVLAAAHDSRFSVNVLNHCSGHLPEIVWNAKITRPIRKALEPRLNLPGLRAVWKAINPTSYLRRLALRPSKTLLIYGWFDAVFPLRYSLCTIKTWRSLGMHCRAVGLPCGHRTLGMAPFNLVDAYHISIFLKENLGER